MPLVGDGGEEVFGRNADGVGVVAGVVGGTEAGEHGLAVGGVAEDAAVHVEHGDGQVFQEDGGDGTLAVFGDVECVAKGQQVFAMGADGEVGGVGTEGDVLRRKMLGKRLGKEGFVGPADIAGEFRAGGELVGGLGPVDARNVEGNEQERKENGRVAAEEGAQEYRRKQEHGEKEGTDVVPVHVDQGQNHDDGQG